MFTFNKKSDHFEFSVCVCFFKVSIDSILVCALSTDYATLNAHLETLRYQTFWFADEKYFSACEVNSEDKPQVNVTCTFPFRVENFIVKEKMSKVQFYMKL